jgi:ankyrin repeat protein
MRKGHVAAVRQLLEAQADINNADSEGITPLAVAADLPKPAVYEVMMLLMQQGTPAPPLSPEKDKEAMQNQLQRVEFAEGASSSSEALFRVPCLTKFGIDDGADSTFIETQTDSVTALPTSPASRLGSAESADMPLQVFRALRERRPVLALELLAASPHLWTATDHYGNSLLHWGALLGDGSFVAEALEHDVFTDARSNNQQTPLMWAITKGHVKVVRQLLEANANIRVKDSLGATPLTIAAQHPSATRYQLMLLLMESGTEELLNDVDYQGCTAAHWSAYKGDLTGLKLLVEFRADLQVLDNSKMLPLHRAVYACKPNVVPYLIESRSDPLQCILDGRNCLDMARKDPLMISVLQGEAEATKPQKENVDAWETLLGTLGTYVHYGASVLDTVHRNTCQNPHDLTKFEDVFNQRSFPAGSELKRFEDAEALLSEKQPLQSSARGNTMRTSYLV